MRELIHLAALIVILAVALASVACAPGASDQAPRQPAAATAGERPGAVPPSDGAFPDDVSEDVPAAVLAAMQAEAGEASMGAIERVEIEGGIAWSAWLEQDGQSRRLVVGADGRLLRGETVISLTDVPAAAMAALRSAHGEFEVRGVEREIMGGEVWYELDVVVQGAALELLVDPLGTRVRTIRDIPLEQVPEAARQAIVEWAGVGTTVDVEFVTDPIQSYYEAAFPVDGEDQHLSVEPDGTALVPVR